jgi:CheY-like chemotaxis protein
MSPTMPTILVVDDDSDFLFYVQKLLEQEGYRVLLAATGLAALKTLAREQPDLVLTDLIMPETDGYELARQLRVSPLRAIPIISLTGHPQRGDIVRGEEKLVDLYLTKPIQTNDLLAAIAICLDPP